MPLTISAVIPTRNRRDDLGNAVASVLSQTRPPDELIVVDQSPGDESATLVHELFGGKTQTRLVYIHDTSVTGLVDAKRVGSARATCDLVSFLEDDVILEPDYMEQLESGFQARPGMQGCSGVITNHPRASPFYVLGHALFFRGIFRDPRVRLTRASLQGATALMPSDVLSGGVSCWRRQVFDHVQFDTANGFHLLEDMEFSTRVVRVMGHHLFINPRARLLHLGSAVNRDLHGTRQRRKMVEALTFYKKRRQWPGALHGLLIVMTWWLGEACLQTLRLRSTGPLRGYVHGVVDGARRPLATADPPIRDRLSAT
jgi:GT2 family glycosyltransferase